MNFEILISEKTEGSEEKFWKAIEIWLKNPHLVNRRISSCTNLLTVTFECCTEEMMKILSNIESFSKILECNAKNDALLDFLKIRDKSNSLPVDVNPLETKAPCLLVNKCLPRNSVKFSAGIEFTIIDKEANNVICYHRRINENQQSLGLEKIYKITYDSEDQFGISIEKKNDNLSDSSVIWLCDHFFPRLRKWIENDSPNGEALVDGSLNLVSPEDYTNLYNKLKQKYGLEMVKKWPECTDPNKFVYEDVAIATYLILLWDNERRENGGNNEKKQSFVDLGCGNGLLVYILTSEGHSGTGIDLRKRQIWDIYPPTTHLEVRTIVPSSASLFPDVDWLIGNHSDELTPWIPVIAARSSYKCRFFLLPCCAHEFDGRKFQRDSAAKSQYFEYMKYIKSVCEGCGFKTDLDKLRIPSTKRICLVGRARTYRMESRDSQDKLVDEIINARSLKQGKESFADDKKVSNESKWSNDFKPRESIERVRNCTRLDRSIIDEIINVVTEQLLRKVRVITHPKSEKSWNAGGQIELAEIAKIIAPETLKQLKNECGGLQTLLRNNSNIFQVTKGTVQFRVPGTERSDKRDKTKNKFQSKVKPCWFYVNHPDGCPVSANICHFKH